MEMTAVIIDVQTALCGGLDAFPRRDSWTVWYFGKRFENLLQIQSMMPSNWSCARVGETLQDAAERLAVSVVNIENAQLYYGQDRTWWDASDLGDRGPYVTNLLEGAAQSLVIEEAVRGGGFNVFIIENADYAHILFSGLTKRGVAVGWKHPRGRIGAMSRIYEGWAFTRRLLISARTMLSGIRYMLRALRATHKGRKARPLAIERLRKCDVIITVWTGRNVFPEDGPLQYERYFGGLPSLLLEHGYKVGYLACTTVGDDAPEQVVSNTLQAHDPVIGVEDCVTAGDVLRAAVGALIAPWRISLGVTVNGVSLDSVMRFERLREMQTWRPMQSRLFHFVGKTFAKHNIHPIVLIHLYENQPWEKILRASVRRYLPDTNVVGYQHVPLAPYFINTYPSAHEIERGLIPDHILVPGKRFMDSLRNWGIPPDKLSVAGGLRFETTLQDCEMTADVSRGAGNDRVRFSTILCCTSIDFDESFELVYKLAATLPAVEGVSVIVNFHPAFHQSSRDRLKALVARFANWNLSRLTYSDAGVHDLLPQADLVAYNTSSSAYDALAARRPVLCILPDTKLGYDRVPDELALHARSIEELKRLVRAFVEGEVHLPPFEKLQDAISTVNFGAFESVIRNALKS